MKKDAMSHVERCKAVMRFQPVDRLPRWEWAMWWDKTIGRWRGEGLPAELESIFDIAQYFGLDPYRQFWFSTTVPGERPGGTVGSMDDYLRNRFQIFPDHTQSLEEMRPWAVRQAKGEAVVWISLEGFFWFPRYLMGFERLMYAFYDLPELIHRLNQDLLAFNLDLLAKVDRVCRPTFLTLAEDMSYNHGPMISQATFAEFLAPYYRQLIGRCREMDVPVFVDTDGDVTKMVPWLLEVGVNGVLPLERQAGVDGNRLGETFPTLLMIGHFDKMVMDKGEEAIRAEFDRLRPLMRRGGFIPSVDHQTPPHVSMEQYRLYRRLLDEYTAAP